MRTAIAGLWALLLLAAGLVHGHAHGHGAHRRGLQTQVITLTEIVVHTILVGDASIVQPTTSAVGKPSCQFSPY
ncbi:hypothetical protein IQ07DRAFT_590722 [Pyrenochaeta sp. DS3sAY3a]|nr:hypothetical protein IQ07DRAFT_590722 [Pyrenochaeta sp. DS3sAY3a]